MASDHFKIKSHGKSDRQKYMEHILTCAQGGPECIMKFSPKQLESPPPKPPRRRYSDQLSGSSLGNYSNKKLTEENQKIVPRSKISDSKPAYLSLPANLTSNLQTECSDSSVLTHSFIPSDQLKYTRGNQLHEKISPDNFKLIESGTKQMYASNRFNNTEKIQPIIQGLNDDMLLKFQYENSTLYPVDKLSRNSLSSNKVFMTSKCGNQNIKSVHKDCHRRHHSDPVISHFNLQNDNNSLKFDQDQHCDRMYSSTRKVKYCESTGNCSCCKKNFLIMQEIRILKEINEKLWQHLCSLQTCLENMKKKAYDECADVSISGLLSSVYYAQKAKDCAIEERLKIVLEERDAALLELEDLINFMTKSFDYSDGEKDVDKDIKELICEMGCTLNPSRLLKYQRMLLAQIHSLKESKQDCIARELKQAVIERDNALDKVRKLEEEVRDLKMSYDLWHSDNKHWEFTIFDILNQLMHQRDTILSKIDNGFDIGNIIFRSPITSRLDSIEHPNISPFESRSKTIESIKSHQSIHLSDYKQKHSFGASDEVMKLKEEIILLNKTLESEMKKREQAEGKCLRLERLIHILRKKLNGQNIGVPV